MICRGIPASSTATNVASFTLIWHVPLAHQPPAEDVAIGVGIGRHRGDADDGLGGGGGHRARHPATLAYLTFAVVHTGIPTPKKSRSLHQISSS